MELRHLRYFCSVAEHRSFTVAARHLHVSQSGVSGQVRDLERELGVDLFQRSQREVRVTPEGLAFWNEAREILLRADRAIELARRSSQGTVGNLTVGLCGPVTSGFLPRLIRRFRQQFSDVSLALRERNPAQQITALLDGQTDVGFTRGVPANLSSAVHQVRLFSEPLLVAIPESHTLAAEETIAVTALSSTPLVLYWRDGAPEIFDAVLSMCQKARFSPRLADTPQSWQTVLTMVESGEGVALVPACVQHFRADDIVYRPLRGKGIRLDALAIWRRDEANILVEKFVTLLRSTITTRPSTPRSRKEKSLMKRAAS